MQPAMAMAATKRAFYGGGGIAPAVHGDEVELVEEGSRRIFGFPAPGVDARPAVTQQFFPTMTATAAAAAQQQAMEQCRLAAAVADQWARPPSRKSRRGPRSRSSQYRGVTFYRRTGRWESHIWDCGKQVYLGGFDTAQAAARAYDQAAIKFRGVDADINFVLDDYKQDIKKMSNFSKEEFVQVLRWQGAGFVRGSSRFRGVSLHKCGKWEARIGQLMGKKYVYLGLYDTEMEASKAYDRAAINCCGKEALTNFEPQAYDGERSLQSWDGELDLELSLGCSGGERAGDPTTVSSDDILHTAPSNRSTSLTFKMPEEEVETRACYTDRRVWIRSLSTPIRPNGAFRCDHHHSSRDMLQMGVMSSSGGKEGAAELQMRWPRTGWPRPSASGGNHWQPYAAPSRLPADVVAAASSGFPPGLGRCWPQQPQAATAPRPSHCNRPSSSGSEHFSTAKAARHCHCHGLRKQPFTSAATAPGSLFWQ